VPIPVVTGLIQKENLETITSMIAMTTDRILGADTVTDLHLVVADLHLEVTDLHLEVTDHHLEVTDLHLEVTTAVVVMRAEITSHVITVRDRMNTDQEQALVVDIEKHGHIIPKEKHHTEEEALFGQGVFIEVIKLVLKSGRICYWAIIMEMYM
jgi:hypothetical protein